MLKDNDEVVFIPMSSGLSGTCQTATMVAGDYDGKVQVVNNQRISVTMRQSVMDAKALADKGKNAEEIKDILEAHKMDSSIYITLETLKYLKKGGRITPAAAAIGTMLKSSILYYRYRVRSLMHLPRQEESHQPRRLCLRL